MDKTKQMTNDWQLTSYGDLGAFAGVGARMSHQKFKSAKLNVSVNTMFLEVGLGGGVDFKLPPLNWLNNAIKVKDGVGAESGYKNLICHRPFSITDIGGALGDCESGAVILGDGCKMVRIAARGNGFGPAGNNLLFTLPVARTTVPGTNGKRTTAGEKGYGASVEASVTSGVFLVVSGGNWLEERGRRDFELMKKGIYRMEPGKA